MKIEIQSDSPTANSLTDRLGAGPRTKHSDTRYFWVQERVQDGDLSIKNVFTAKNCADVGTMPVSACLLQQHCKFAGFGILLTMNPTHDKMKVAKPMMDREKGCNPDIDEQKPDVNTETWGEA